MQRPMFYSKNRNTGVNVIIKNAGIGDIFSNVKAINILLGNAGSMFYPEIMWSIRSAVVNIIFKNAEDQ